MYCILNHRKYGCLVCLITFLGLGMVFQASAIDPTTDKAVMLYFSFDEGVGDTVKDLSGNNNDGVITKAQWVDGKYDKALEFNGKDAGVEVAGSATLDLQKGMTLASWVFKTEYLLNNNGETMISKKQGGAYCLEIHGWNTRFPQKLSTEPRISGTYHPLGSDEDFPLGRWAHAAATYDGEMVRLYLDGKMVKEEKWPGTIDVNGANLYIGAESDGNNPDATHGRFAGLIDEVVIADRAFTEVEISELMEAGASVEAPGKLAVTWARIKTQ